MILHGDGKLRGDLIQQGQVFLLKRFWTSAAEYQNSQSTLGAKERNATQCLQPFRKKVLCDFSLKFE
jgi:hypothetical protein